jgi:hypothetical protein
MAALEQPATVPTPGSILVRSKCIVPAATLNVAKSGIETGPTMEGPTRFIMVPPVRPTKSPVLSSGPFPGTYEFTTFVPVPLKKIPPLFTVALPEKVACPVTLSAKAGVTKAAALKATKLKRE